MVAAEFNAELKDDKTLPTSTAAKKPKLQSGITSGNCFGKTILASISVGGLGFSAFCRDFMGQPNQKKMDNGASGQRFNNTFKLTDHLW